MRSREGSGHRQSKLPLCHARPIPIRPLWSYSIVAPVQDRKCLVRQRIAAHRDRAAERVDAAHPSRRVQLDEEESRTNSPSVIDASGFGASGLVLATLCMLSMSTLSGSDREQCSFHRNRLSPLLRPTCPEVSQRTTNNGRSSGDTTDRTTTARKYGTGCPSIECVLTPQSCRLRAMRRPAQPDLSHDTQLASTWRTRPWHP
jgi:hypothetical protein